MAQQADFDYGKIVNDDCDVAISNTPSSITALALKSNILFDAASVVNVGIETPIGKHLSLSAEVYFPWWTSLKYDVTIAMTAGMLEGRYWFGNRNRPRLTGFFCGAYAGAGYYDFQWGGDGAQGEMFIMGGGSIGYAHTISKNLRLEYTVGVGYLMTDYRKYYSVEDAMYGKIKVRKYPWQTNRFTGVLPTKAGVSLVWSINRKKERRHHEK